MADNLQFNLQLDKTIKLPNPAFDASSPANNETNPEYKDFDINAVYSDEAGKVTKSLKLKSSTKGGYSTIPYQGDSEHTICYVPADQGGVFRNPVYLSPSNPNAELAENEVLTCEQINTKISNLKSSRPICLWDNRQLSLLEEPDANGIAPGFRTITGTEQDFFLLQFMLGIMDQVTQSTGPQSGATKPYYTEGPSIRGFKYKIRNDNPDAGWILTGLINNSYEYPTGSGQYTEVPTGDLRISCQAVGNIVDISGDTLVEGLTQFVTEIGDSAFADKTSITSIILPETINKIGNAAFSGCTNLKSITIPSSVTSIGANAFAGCSNLTLINYNSTAADWDNISISTGNDALSNATKNYTPSSANSIEGLPDLEEPFIYICKDSVASGVPNANKIYLKLPGKSQNIITISNSAVRLESPYEDAENRGRYYTYETLAAIIAGINSRLAALGSTDLTLPQTVTIDGVSHPIIPNTLIADEETLKSEAVLVEETIVPSVQSLQEQIDELKGGDGDSIEKLRNDLNELANEVYFDLYDPNASANLLGETVAELRDMQQLTSSYKDIASEYKSRLDEFDEHTQYLKDSSTVAWNEPPKHNNIYIQTTRPKNTEGTFGDIAIVYTPIASQGLTFIENDDGTYTVTKGE